MMSAGFRFVIKCLYFVFDYNHWSCYFVVNVNIYVRSAYSFYDGACGLMCFSSYFTLYMCLVRLCYFQSVTDVLCHKQVFFVLIVNV